jgi:hypothetical protein
VALNSRLAVNGLPQLNRQPSAHRRPQQPRPGGLRVRLGRDCRASADDPHRPRRQLIRSALPKVCRLSLLAGRVVLGLDLTT